MLQEAREFFQGVQRFSVSVVIELTVIKITATAHWMFFMQYAMYLVSLKNNYIKLSSSLSDLKRMKYMQLIMYVM